MGMAESSAKQYSRNWFRVFKANLDKLEQHLRQKIMELRKGIKKNKAQCYKRQDKHDKYNNDNE